MGIENMKQRRLAMGLTQKQVAKLCGRTSAHIGLIERGDAKPSEELEENIEAVLSGKRIVKKKRTPEESELHELYVKLYGGTRPAYAVSTGMDRE